MLKLGVLASGRGTALQGVIDAIQARTLDAKIELIISNKSDALILERAKIGNIKYIFVNPKGTHPLEHQVSPTTVIASASEAIQENQLSSPGLPRFARNDGSDYNPQTLSSLSISRERYDEILSALFKEHQVDLILLVGYMRILSNNFINDWRDKILNVHPSLLPAFAGLMDIGVHQAVLDSGVKETGCTIHRVNEVVDGGEILLQKPCSVEANDTVESLKQKVQALENIAFVEIIQQLT